MTQLTEHARAILRAIADGQQIEVIARGEWINASLCDVAWQLGEDCTKARIKPEVRSINGREFGALVNDGGHQFSLDMLSTFEGYRWEKTEDVCTAYQAIVDALEGTTK